MGTELLWKSGPNCVSRILLEMSGKALWPATANLHRLVRLAFSFYRWANGDAEQQSQRKSVSELSKAESEYTPSAPSLVRLASSSPHTPKWQEICFVPYREGKKAGLRRGRILGGMIFLKTGWESGWWVRRGCQWEHNITKSCYFSCNIHPVLGWIEAFILGEEELE